MTAFVTQSVASSFRAFVLNIRNEALSEYNPFPFNSICSHDGKLYGASDSGIHEIGSQSTDNGTIITATVRTGKHDFDTSKDKRIPRLYVDYKSDGALLFSSITISGLKRSYLLPGNGNTTFEQRRVSMGTGPKSAYWQFEISNKNGADFSLSRFLVHPIRQFFRV